LLARLEEVVCGTVGVVYNSHNVEIALKQRIIREECFAAPPGLLEGVEALERGLVARAAGICTCTPTDADEYVKWGAPRVVVAPNGGVRTERRHLLDILPSPLRPAHSYALVVGSDHPPNISGIMNLIIPSLALLRPHQRVVVAGLVGSRIIQSLEAKGLADLIKGRLIVLGVVDEFCLDCLIANSKVLLLPIQYGGGSNVKTAEALLSRRPIIAAPAAMRGFDAFRDAPNITVADGTVDFGTDMLAALDRPHSHEGPDHPALSSVLWESTIAPIVGLMREMEREIRADPRSPLSSPFAAEHTAHAA
jgi:hypothetical protein